ncbi:hypothetical protein D3C75_576260 [compost metagenome]
MRGAYNDPVFPGKLSIGKRMTFAVNTELCAPHRRPEIIPLQPENQLKDLFIECFVEIPKCSGYP